MKIILRPKNSGATASQNSSLAMCKMIFIDGVLLQLNRQTPMLTEVDIRRRLIYTNTAPEGYDFQLSSNKHIKQAVVT